MENYRKVLIIFIFECLLISLSTGAKCVLNPFYNPVCGSDNKTYGNKDIFNCFNSERPFHRKINIIAHRECKPLICPSYQDLNSVWPSSNSNSLVCTNNGFTMDIHQVRCLKDFHPNLEIIHSGGCSLFELRKALGRKNRKHKACTEKRRLFEENSICLSNNITIKNPFQALCEYSNPHEKIGGICGCPIQRSCQRAQDLLKSIKVASPKERVKFAVCGSDRKTYRSEDHLECSRRYNFYLHIKHRGKCNDQTETCAEKLKHTRISMPVCASDNQSYINFEAFICAQTRINPRLRFKHSGACVKVT